MAKKEADGNPQSSNTAKNVVRGVVLVLLIGLLVAAGLDFVGKNAWDSTYKAVESTLNGAGGSIPASEIDALIEGSPTVTGDLKKDAQVKYKWGVIRNYEMTLTAAGAPDARVVTNLETNLQ